MFAPTAVSLVDGMRFRNLYFNQGPHDGPDMIDVRYECANVQLNFRYSINTEMRSTSPRCNDFTN